MRSVLLSLGLLVASVAHAQEMGLDLTEPSTPPEFKPSIAVVGILPQGTTPQENAVLEPRAQKSLDALMKIVGEGDSYSKVVPPADAKGALGGDAQATLLCAEAACFVKAADTLDVDRVLVGTLGYFNGETRLLLFGYDRGSRQVVSGQVESNEKAAKRQLSAFSGIGGKSPAQKDADFLARASGPLYELVGKTKTPLGTLDIRSYEQDVAVTLNGKPAGTGAFTKNLAAGEYALHAESPTVQPWDTTVKVEPLKTTEVALTLVAKLNSAVAANAAVTQQLSTSLPLYRRPGLYVALAGVVAMGVGMAVGASAKGIEDRAVDANNDGVLDVTREEVVGARGTATLANVFIGVGGAAVVGGGLWMFLAPGTGTAAAKKKTEEPTEGSGGGLGNGLTLGVGGSF